LATELRRIRTIKILRGVGVFGVALSASLTLATTQVAHSAPRCNPPVKGAPFKSIPSAYRTATTWVYGDSITYQTYAALGIDSVAVDAYWGRTTKHGVKAVISDLRRYQHRPKSVVIALGTNDRHNRASFAAQVRRVIKVVPRRVRLIWVNVYSTEGTTWESLNRVLDRKKRLNVVRWAENQQPDYLLDSIHVVAAGCTARNALIRKALSD